MKMQNLSVILVLSSVICFQQMVSAATKITKATLLVSSIRLVHDKISNTAEVYKFNKCA